MSSEKAWERYEDVTRQLLLDIREFLGISKVESKQQVQGNSGTEWEVDVVAYDNNTGKIVLVECKRWQSKLPQSEVGGFAYRINDTNAERGIIVTKMGLQEGAEKVAKYENITFIKLTVDVTNYSDDYIAKLSNRLFIKVTNELVTSTSCSSLVTFQRYKFSNTVEIEETET